MYRMSKDTNDIDESSCRSLIQQGDQVPAELYREFMQDIVAEIDRENVIISDLLSLVKLDKKAAQLQITTVSINELLEIIMKRFKNHWLCSVISN